MSDDTIRTTMLDIPVDADGVPVLMAVDSDSEIVDRIRSWRLYVPVVDDGSGNKIPIVRILGGDGPGGTTNYNLLTNKPSLGGVTLQGDKSLADLGILPIDDQIVTVAPSSGTATIDIGSKAQIYQVSTSTALTLAVSNATLEAGLVRYLQIWIDLQSDVAVTWFAGIQWLDGSGQPTSGPPALTIGLNRINFELQGNGQFIGQFGYRS